MSNKPEFQFVGETEGVTKSRKVVEWTEEAHCIILAAHYVDKKSAREAYELGRQHLGMSKEDFPKTYKSVNAAGAIYGERKRFLARANKGNPEAIRLGLEYGLLKPKAQVEEASEASEVEAKS